MNATTAEIDSLDGQRLSCALRAGIRRLHSCQEHLNKINVFPVPDGDTGTNLVLTMNAVLLTLRGARNAQAGETLTRVADAALDGARGNSGPILAQFFLGLGDHLGHLGRVGPDEFAGGVRGGAGTFACFRMFSPSAYAAINPYSMPLWTIFTKWPAPLGPQWR